MTIALYNCCLYAPKCLKKLVFDAIFEFVIENNRLSGIKSGFKPNDSCVNQLISITQCFYALGANPSLEVRGVFLDFKGIWQSLALRYSV